MSRLTYLLTWTVTLSAGCCRLQPPPSLSITQPKAYYFIVLRRVEQFTVEGHAYATCTLNSKQWLHGRHRYINSLNLQQQIRFGNSIILYCILFVSAVACLSYIFLYLRIFSWCYHYLAKKDYIINRLVVRHSTTWRPDGCVRWSHQIRRFMHQLSFCDRSNMAGETCDFIFQD